MNHLDHLLPGHMPSCAAKVPIFRVLPTAAISQLGKAMYHRTFAKGDVVADEDTVFENLLVVDTGHLKLVHASASGREQVVRTLGAGDFLGEMALFAPVSLGGYLVAIEETTTCMVPRHAMQSVLLTHPYAALTMVEALAQRLARAEELAAALGLHDVGQRLARALLQLADNNKNDKPRVQVPVHWAEMAVRLGTTPESLSRRLRVLAQKGIIRQERGRKVVIIDKEHLLQVAQG